jgi:chromosome segregation ATPase
MKKLMVVGALFVIGCASHKPQAKLDDSGLARLNEQQMQPVDDARIEQGRAHDAVSRARANEAEARSRLEVARSEREVLDAQLKRAVAERDMLKKSYGERSQLARAEDEIAGIQQRIKAADLKMQYLEKMIAVAEAERRAAEAHETTAAARVEQAKHHAMLDAGAPQASSINGAELDKRLAEAQMQEAQAQKEAAEKRSVAIDLYNRWQEADSKVRMLARPSSVPAAPPAPHESSK